MNWNTRYAHESFHFWPDDIDELIEHMSTHHHGQFQEIVTHYTNMVNKLGDSVPADRRTDLLNGWVKAHLTEALDKGTIEPDLMLAQHDFWHGRTDGPDRGYDFITVQNPEKAKQVLNLIDHKHTTIPEL